MYVVYYLETNALMPILYQWQISDKIRWVCLPMFIVALWQKLDDYCIPPVFSAAVEMS